MLSLIHDSLRVFADPWAPNDVYTPSEYIFAIKGIIEGYEDKLVKR